jgi:hypothetical protein
MKGLQDLQQGLETIEAMLVAIGAPRLRGLGLAIPEDLPAVPEHQLYFLLQEIHGDDAHSQYNSLIRRLVSYERAAECGL